MEERVRETGKRKEEGNCYRTRDVNERKRQRERKMTREDSEGPLEIK